MELGLRLGDAPPFGFPQKPREPTVSSRGLDFCLGFSSIYPVGEEDDETQNQKRKELDDGGGLLGRFCAPMDDDDDDDDDDEDSPLLQLDLLPRTPVVRRNSSPSGPRNFSRRSSETDVSEAAGFSARSIDVINAAPPSAMVEAAEGGGDSPRNAVLSSSFEPEFCRYGGGAGRFFQPENNTSSGFELEDGSERACSRASDENDQNMGSRKKLRLSREQSAFLEESFKEHHTLYPKQKLELARRLNLRPRQVEVWFQNRRARTKLKQTEVDCEYLKKCCETLTQENRKLQKELRDLRALKTTDSLYMHSPATTLTMCPSCERVAAATSTAAAMLSGREPKSKASGFSFTKPVGGLYPFTHTEPTREQTK